MDILGPALQSMAAFMEENPLETPGIVHMLDDDYFKKLKRLNLR